MLTLLVVVMLWALAGGRARAEARVVTATAELREAERTAHRQVALLNGILDRISDGVGVVDEHGGFLVHNPAAKAHARRGRRRGPASTGGSSTTASSGPTAMTPFPAEELPLVRALAGESTDRVEMVIRNAARPRAPCCPSAAARSTSTGGAAPSPCSTTSRRYASAKAT